jgi:hypothetical protein
MELFRGVFRRDGLSGYFAGVMGALFCSMPDLNYELMDHFFEDSHVQDDIIFYMTLSPNTFLSNNQQLSITIGSLSVCLASSTYRGKIILQS